MDGVLVRCDTGTAVLPRLIADAGGNAARRFLEFFTVTIRNPNTRAAYAEAARQFLAWCEARDLALHQVEPVLVAAYIEHHPGSPATVKQHLAALRMLFDWLVTGQVLRMNPAASVRGPRHVVKRGKTPVLAAEDTRRLFDAIDVTTLIGLRDRAFLGVMVYSFARVGAVVGMRVGDYYQNGKRWWLRLHEKGGKFHEVPAHHTAEAYLDEYLESAGIGGDKKGPLFRTMAGRRGRLTAEIFDRRSALYMVKRRATAVGLPTTISNHTFRATGITVYRKNGGSLEKAAMIAAHESMSTTKLYDRSSDEVSLDEIERIVI
jgi:site-specific recombinase XerD